MTDNLIILNFQEARQPEYREKKGVGYIEFGDKNDYPSYLLTLFNKSAKHNAIIKGKVNYITGNGWASKEADPGAELFIKQPNAYESLDELTRKVSTDIELFGGAYLELIWSQVGGMVTSVCHIDYTKIRSNKDNTSFWYKKDWSDRKEEAVVLPAFSSTNRVGKQIMYMKEYRPGLDTYALPGWMGCLNYIESDIEVGRHVLGNAQTGFSASKLITLPNGEPTPDEKRNIERRFTDRFSGSDGKKFILSFVNDSSKKPIVEDLGASDITKEDFTRVDAIIQQNLFAGHQVISPMLFGIKTEGQLGGASELRNSYEIFKNTYINDKQRFIEQIFNFIARLRGATQNIFIQPVEPIGFEFSESIMAQNMTKEEIRSKLNLPALETNTASQAQVVTDSINSLSPLVANKVLESMTPNEIRSLVGLLPKEGGDLPPVGSTDVSQPGELSEGMTVNENIKNMTGRQHQQLLRIIRQVGQGKITREVAQTMLKAGLGLSDEDINTMLGSDEQFNDHDITAMFSEVGEGKDNYLLLQSMPLRFDAAEGMDLTFAESVITDTKEKQVLEILNKEPKTAPKDLSRVLRIPEDEINAMLDRLISNEVITYNPKTSERKLSEPIKKLIDAPPATTIVVRYSYEWKLSVPGSERDTAAHPSRAFCKKMLDMDKFYSMREIQTLSARLGYDVFDRGGGWWGNSPSCRHEWRANRVIKK